MNNFVPVFISEHLVWLDVHLRLVGQEGDIDLRQSLGGFGSAALNQLIEERIRTGYEGQKKQLHFFWLIVCTNQC